MNSSDAVTVGGLLLVVGVVLALASIQRWWDGKLTCKDWKLAGLAPAVLIGSGLWVLHGMNTYHGHPAFDWPFQTVVPEGHTPGAPRPAGWVHQ